MQYYLQQMICCCGQYHGNREGVGVGLLYRVNHNSYTPLLKRLSHTEAGVSHTPTFVMQANQTEEGRMHCVFTLFECPVQLNKSARLLCEAEGGEGDRRSGARQR